jgi:hypothetical protein
MKKNLFFAGIISILLVFGLILTGCMNPAATDNNAGSDDDDDDGGGAGGGTVATVTGVTVSPPTANVAKNGTVTFTATVAGTNSPAQTVTWSVSGGNADTAISSDGVLTVAAAETAGTLIVTATSTVNPGISGTAAVTVTAVTATVTGVTVTPPMASVPKGGSQSFTATVTGTNNPAQTVTWTVTGGAPDTSISPAGALTIAAAETPGTTLIITATSTVNPGISGTAGVTVTAEIATVTGVTVSPSPASVPKGGTQIFTATVAGTNNPGQSVTWSVTGGVTGTDITPGGILIVAAGEIATDLIITATSTVNPGISGTAGVTVTAEIATVTGVTVSPPVASVAKGGTQTFSATVAGTNSPAQSVTWSVTGGVTGTVITSGGVLTVAASETAGALFVTATATVNPAISGMAGVTVTAEIVTVTGVTVSPSSASVAKGGTQTFSATVAGTNSPGQSVTWSVTGGVTGTVITSGGVLTVAALETAGALFVTATSTVNPGISGMAAVTVTGGSTGDGDGTPGDPFQITTAAGLTAKMQDANNLDKHFKLMNNITLTSPWTPVGTWTAPFRGTLDGNGKTVTFGSSLSWRVAGTDAYAGLFGVIDRASEPGSAPAPVPVVKNLTITGTVTLSDTTANRFIYAGALAGYVKTGHIEHITADVDLSVSADSLSSLYVGGIAGVYETSTDDSYMISSSCNTGDISASATNVQERVSAGGIVGWNSGGMIPFSYSSGNISAVIPSGTPAGDAYAGGIAGGSSGMINRTYSNGTVSAAANSDAYAGGIAGKNNNWIVGAYSNGTVSATTSGASSVLAWAGGIAGDNSSGIITETYSRGTVSAAGIAADAGGIAGYANNGQINRSVALTTNVTATGSTLIVARVGAGSGSILERNWALSSMTLTGGTASATTHNGQDGADFSSPTSQSSWTPVGASGPGFTFSNNPNSWKWDAANNIPKLGWEP